jgi:glutamate mutase epsilon subunit
MKTFLTFLTFFIIMFTNVSAREIKSYDFQKVQIVVCDTVEWAERYRDVVISGEKNIVPWILSLGFQENGERPCGQISAFMKGVKPISEFDVPWADAPYNKGYIIEVELSNGDRYISIGTAPFSNGEPA